MALSLTQLKYNIQLEQCYVLGHFRMYFGNNPANVKSYNLVDESNINT